MTHPCPGHEGKCKFCKSEVGNVQTMVDGSVEINRVTEKPIVAPCCKPCRKNMKYADKFDPDVNARFR